MKKRLNKGFTLVELMVVLVIIGILAVMAIPKFFGATNKTKATECKPVLKEIYTLQSAYYMEKNAYAADSTVLGFKKPDGSTRYSYDAKNGATNNMVGLATLTEAVGDAAIGAKACINSTSMIFAHTTDTKLAGYLNVAVAGCP